ncbi:hypothetical protein P3S68_024526 [Capsicum galapagoense]
MPAAAGGKAIAATAALFSSPRRRTPSHQRDLASAFIFPLPNDNNTNSRSSRCRRPPPRHLFSTSPSLHCPSAAANGIRRHHRRFWQYHRKILKYMMDSHFQGQVIS